MDFFARLKFGEWCTFARKPKEFNLVFVIHDINRRLRESHLISIFDHMYCLIL